MINNLLANLDYTLEKYTKLCQAVAESGYINVTFKEYLTFTPPPGGHYLILRHDVDENCKYALDLALKEQQYDLKSTYYFRMRKTTCVPRILDRIAACKHEIGYHYETVDKCHGDIEAAAVLFRRELTSLRQRYPVETACMHGNPLTKYDNKKIWERYNFSQFKLLGEPYLSLDYTKFTYFSDSGRTWGSRTLRKTKDVVRDSTTIVPKNTDDLIEIIKRMELDNICILTHPERWSKNITDYSRRYLIDMAYLAGKTMVHLIRN
jgi:hypothetical protein